jgi:NAD(P)-dependent dehydrogenase (short-subunit alcohol dehydrogenase family)
VQAAPPRRGESRTGLRAEDRAKRAIDRLPLTSSGDYHSPKVVAATHKGCAIDIVENTDQRKNRGRTVLRALDGKVAVVSGAGSVAGGISNGRAISILLARAGARLGLIDISRESAEETAVLVAREGSESVVVAADVANLEQSRAAVAEVVAKFAAVNILVNNVGITGARGTAVQVDPDEWDETMRINVKSMMLMTKHCVPHMEAAGGGAIVNIASIAGLRGGHPSLAYPTTKGAVVNMTRAMAHHHGPAGIRVNCVAPGLVYTPRVAARGLDDATRTARRMQAPLHTEGTAWDVAEAVLYLVTDSSRWVSGEILTVDAGLIAGTGAVGAH